LLLLPRQQNPAVKPGFFIVRSLDLNPRLQTGRGFSRFLFIETNLVWTPLPGFDIGAEFMYALLNHTRPVGLAPDSVLTATGLPAFKPATSQYAIRLRIQRAF
jgi:hypothetical protein